MNYTPAKAIADRLALNLKDRCERIEIAGSIRRLKADPGDIEIVCVPKIDRVFDMFQQPVSQVSQLDTFPWGIYGAIIKNGDRYKQLDLFEGIKLDLFIVLPPADWGVIFTIRTGPADFSKFVVTKRRQGGALPSDCRVDDGRVIRGGTPILDPTGEFIHHWEGGDHIQMPEEIHFLNFLGLGWVEPEKRAARWPK